MTYQHELLEEYEKYYPRKKEIWLEINLNLKIADKVYENYPNVWRQFREEIEGEED